MIAEKFRYMGVQGFSYCLEMGLFYTLYSYVKIENYLANLTAKIIVGIFAYIMHSKYSFRQKSDESSLVFIKYTGLLMANVFFSTVIFCRIYEFVEYDVISKFVADFAYFYINFVLCKNFIFSK